MKSTFILALFILLLPLIGFSQQELNQKQVLEDYTVLKNVLTQGHPNLYAYTSMQEWDSLFESFEEETSQDIRSKNDLYRSITELNDHVRDGHLIVMRPPLDPIPKLFPVLVKIIDQKLYTDTDDFGIPVGSEITSIDGINSTELRERFLKYAPADGINITKKDRQVEREFGILHFYEFGPKASYQINYKTPSGELLEKTIESQSFESIGQRFGNRNSFFDKQTLGKKEPVLRYPEAPKTAILTMNTFQWNVEKFQATLKDIFQEINQKKVEHLIIDIRQNEGGYPLNAIHAFSYLASEPFKQNASSEVVTATLPEEQYSQNLVNGYTYESFFKKYYRKGKKYGSHWKSTKDENESLMVPHKKPFEGKVYVLIGGKTFSAGSSFALFCKNQGIPLIGEETGGGYYTQTGGYPIIYTLPNSKIKILVSLVRVNRFVKDQSLPHGIGILPDQEVQQTVSDLIQGKDTQLEYLLNQINSK